MVSKKMIFTLTFLTATGMVLTIVYAQPIIKERLYSVQPNSGIRQIVSPDTITTILPDAYYNLEELGVDEEYLDGLSPEQRLKVLRNARTEYLKSLGLDYPVVDDQNAYFNGKRLSDVVVGG